MEGTDVCFAPVLSMAEAPHHPHNKSRAAFIDIEGVTQPAPIKDTKPVKPVAPAAVARQRLPAS